MMRKKLNVKIRLALAIGVASASPALVASQSDKQADAVSGFFQTVRDAESLGLQKAHLPVLTGKYQLKVGLQAVFARNERNGAVRVIPNANALSTLVGPFGKTDVEHNRAVLEYFVAAGLPADQVTGVDVKHLVGDSAPARRDLRASKLIARYSMIRRAIDKIPVFDSVAWARLNTHRTVVSQTVHWPAIPRSVVTVAKSMAAQVAEGHYVRSLPDEVQEVMKNASRPGVVCIRHGGVDDEMVGAVASFDILDETSRKPRERHFDASGKEFSLPREHIGDTTSRPAARRKKAH